MKFRVSIRTLALATIAGAVPLGMHAAQSTGILFWCWLIGVVVTATLLGWSIDRDNQLPQVAATVLFWLAVSYLVLESTR